MLWLIALSSNYKSLVDLFKGRGCGQSPQKLSVYAIVVSEDFMGAAQTRNFWKN